MKNEKLLNAMGNIQDGLILDAAPGKAERKPKRLRRGLAVALAAALILTLTVGVGAATGTFQTLEDLFSPAFYYDEPEPALDMEIMEKLGRPVGVSATDQGITITVDSVIRDRYTCTIVTSVHMDGLDGNEVFYNWCTGGGALAGFNNPGAHVRDVTPGDDTIQIICTWTSNSPIPAGMATVTISDIVLNQHRFLREKTIEGTWELEFDAGYEDISLDLPAGQAVNVEGTEIVLDEITISPLSMRVNYTADLDGVDLEEIVRNEPPYEMSLRQRLEGLDIVITKKDGTRFFASEYHMDECEDEGYGHVKGGGGNVEKQDGVWKGFTSMEFAQMLPLDEIESVTVEGVEIPLA